jgi:hypothetical protein
VTGRGDRPCDEEIEIESRVFGIPVGEDIPRPPKEGQILTARTQIILLVALIVGWYVFKALWMAWWSP